MSSLDDLADIIRSERADEQLRTAAELIEAAHARADQYDGRTREGRAVRGLAFELGDVMRRQRPGARAIVHVDRGVADPRSERPAVPPTTPSAAATRSAVQDPVTRILGTKEQP